MNCYTIQATTEYTVYAPSYEIAAQAVKLYPHADVGADVEHTESWVELVGKVMGE
jgi:hypothetical protein